jgi:hypothetical protein
MFFIIWEYHVRAEYSAAFEEVYSATGAWAKLFQKSKDYLGTELLCDVENSLRYLTIDRWTSAQEYASFLAEWKNEYEDLDAQCDPFAEKESLVGKWKTASSEIR